MGLLDGLTEDQHTLLTQSHNAYLANIFSQHQENKREAAVYNREIVSDSDNDTNPDDYLTVKTTNSIEGKALLQKKNLYV